MIFWAKNFKRAKVAENWINNCDFFKVRNFREGWPLWILVPCAKRPSYASDVMNQKRNGRNLRNVACLIGRLRALRSSFVTSILAGSVGKWMSIPAFFCFIVGLTRSKPEPSLHISASPESCTAWVCVCVCVFFFACHNSSDTESGPVLYDTWTWNGELNRSWENKTPIWRPYDPEEQLDWKSVCAE